MKNKKDDKTICTILTVDDELGIDSFFYEFFTLRNFRVLTASSGKQAVKIAEKENPQLILLDINMRGMDGMEALKRIKEINKEICVIMVTGVKDEETRNKALGLGADDYITKPLSMEYLEKVVLLKFLNAQIRDVKKQTEEFFKP